LWHCGQKQGYGHLKKLLHQSGLSPNLVRFYIGFIRIDQGFLVMLHHQRGSANQFGVIAQRRDLDCCALRQPRNAVFVPAVAREVAVPLMVALYPALSVRV